MRGDPYGVNGMFKIRKGLQCYDPIEAAYYETKVKLKMLCSQIFAIHFDGLLSCCNPLPKLARIPTRLGIDNNIWSNPQNLKRLHSQLIWFHHFLLSSIYPLRLLVLGSSPFCSQLHMVTFSWGREKLK